MSGPRLDLADVIAIACELLDARPADLVGVLDVDAATETLAAVWSLPPEAPVHVVAATTLHGIVTRPPVPRGSRSLAVLVAAEAVRRGGLRLSLPAEPTRKLVHEVAAGGLAVDQIATWVADHLTLDAPAGAALRRMSASARQMLESAADLAGERGYTFIGTEHVVAVLLRRRSESAVEALRRAGVDYAALHHAADDLVADRGAARDVVDGGNPVFTPRTTKVLDLSAVVASSFGHEAIEPAHLLVAHIREGEGLAAQLLRRFDVDRDAVESAVTAIGSERRWLTTTDAAAVPWKDEDDLVRLYLTDISAHPLLSADEERTLAKAIERGRVGNPTRDEVEAGADATKRLVESNLRLVVSIAKRYQQPGRRLLDLIQEGNLGLLQAVDRFDWRKGFRFSTYATWWIRQAIHRSVSPTAPAPPAFDMPDDVDWIRPSRTYRPPAAVATPDVPKDDEAMERIGLLPGLILAMLEPLTDRERSVLELRLGVGGRPPATVDEVVAETGVPAEEVARIDMRVLARFGDG